MGGVEFVGVGLAALDGVIQSGWESPVRRVGMSELDWVSWVM